jgi:hypothetical protein
MQTAHSMINSSSVMQSPPDNGTLTESLSFFATQGLGQSEESTVMDRQEASSDKTGHHDPHSRENELLKLVAALQRQVEALSE